MILADTNLLLYCARSDLDEHAAARSWLQTVLEGDGLFLADSVVVALVRIATDSRIFPRPSLPNEVVGFVTALRGRRGVRALRTSDRHQRRFLELCVETGLTGNDVPDVYLAALALTEPCTLASADRGFERFDGLDWINPLGPA